MEKLAAVLGNMKDHDAWAQRRDALIRLREMLRAGAANSAAFVEGFLALKAALVSNCADLRSAIVKEACDTVSFAALCLGQRAEPLLPELLEVLLQLTVNSKQIMADAGHDCIRTIVCAATARGFARLLPQIFAAAESRSTVLSTNALVYVPPLVACVYVACKSSCSECSP